MQGIGRKTSRPIKGPPDNPEMNNNGVMTTRWLQGLREEIELLDPEAGVTGRNRSHERARATSEALLLGLRTEASPLFWKVCGVGAISRCLGFLAGEMQDPFTHQRQC